MTPSRRQQRDLSELDAAQTADHTFAAVPGLSARPQRALVARLAGDIVSHVRTRADVVRCSIETALVSLILQPAGTNGQQHPTERP